MTAPEIRLPVDVTNPGQFFACCGLFELADRLWRGTEAWFDLPRASFVIQPLSHTSDATLAILLEKARSISFQVGKTDDNEEDPSDDDGELDPIIIDSPISLQLDWWSEKYIKPWAGSMKERTILKAMLQAIDPACTDPLNDSKVVFDPAPEGRRAKKPKKREPFYFDCRRGSVARPLDSGFSPDVHHMTTECYPAVEAMCFLGLQRARPMPSSTPNRSSYTTWTVPLPVNAIAPIVCGIATTPESQTLTFENFFRTDQRKHKSYSRATVERKSNV